LSTDANLEAITDSIRSVQEMRNLRKRKNFRECSLGFEANKVSHKIDSKQANLVQENNNASDDLTSAQRTQKKLFDAYMN
jgi:serine phosphatase RsbU (regulator of sigma subunit)